MNCLKVCRACHLQHTHCSLNKHTVLTEQCSVQRAMFYLCERGGTWSNQPQSTAALYLLLYLYLCICVFEYLYLRQPVEQGVWHCCEGGGTWSNPVGNQLQSTTATLTNDHCQLYNCARQCTWRHQCVLCNQPSLVELSVNSTSSKQWSQLHPMYYVYMCTFMCTKLVLPTYMYLYVHVFGHNCTLCKCASMQLYKCVWLWINRPATGVSRDYWSVKHLNLRGNTTGASYIHYILHIEE